MNFKWLLIIVLSFPAFLLSQDYNKILKTATLHHESLYKSFEKKNQPDSALFHYALFITYNDSSIARINREAEITKEIKFNYQKKIAADSVRANEQQRVANAMLEQSEATLRKDRIIRAALFGGLGLVVIFSIYMVNRFRLVKRQKKIIEMQKKIVEHQKLLTEIKQAEILGSIYYAKRIQTALLTNEKYIARVMKKLISK
ncbi:MAG: hypothetical protein ACXVO9_13530 [Bacteroidia bacterium]